ncbi:MAG: zinc-ribbon domain-containing protein [Candidatus Binataceae bacterium]
MIEIQCTSCHTRYRIDERVLPDETPTFKCSRCGHVFNADPGAAHSKKASVRDISSAPPRPQRFDSPPVAPEPPEIEPEAPAAPEPIEPPRAAEPAQPQAAEPSTDDLMSRPFSREPDEQDEGGNLTFDFSDEGKPGDLEDIPDAPMHAKDGAEWQVGEVPEESEISKDARSSVGFVAAAAPPSPVALSRVDPPRPPQRANSEKLQFAQPRFTSAAASGGARVASAERNYISDRLPDDLAYIESRGAAHSAGWFVGVFFLVAVGFGLASMIICGAPVASARMLSQLPGFGARFTRPVVPATLVALRDVRAQYLPIKGGATALMVSGTAENVGNDPLHDILIAIDLLDGTQRQIGGQASYCGNGLSEKMVGEMTPREIEFLQRLDPQRNFAVASEHSAPFLMVFIDPPRKTATLRISVAKAAASTLPAAATVPRT